MSTCRPRASALVATTSSRPLATNAGGGGHGVEHVLQADPDLPGGRTPPHGSGAGAGRAGEVEQVGVLGVVELQGTGDGLQHAVGRAAQIALLQPGVVVGADPGELGDLLAAQARHPAAGAVQRHAGLLGAELRPPAGEEVPDLRLVVHALHDRDGGPAEGGPARTRITLPCRTGARAACVVGMQVPAYAAPSAGRPLAPTSIERRDVGPNDVLIEIEFAGICHSDIHTVHGDWGPQPFPVVPGHEIVGVVAEVGPEVTRHRVGDRVGVGCMVNSCGQCANCRNGDEQFCLDGTVFTYASTDRDGTSTQGGYSTHVVVDAGFVLSVPESLDPAAAAPLLCAGITTYNPLRRWGAGPGKKVAVVGLGGLGHMAVKIAHAMGAEVTVLSQSLKKQEDGLRLGADEYHATGDPETFEKLAGRFDIIINTVSADIDTNAYLRLLGVEGALVNVGVAPEPLSVDGALLAPRRSVTGSMIGGIALTQEMLEFCAEHGIGSEVEVIAAEKINEAYERVLASDVRYRFVIDAATIA